MESLPFSSTRRMTDTPLKNVFYKHYQHFRSLAIACQSAKSGNSIPAEGIKMSALLYSTLDVNVVLITTLQLLQFLYCKKNSPNLQFPIISRFFTTFLRNVTQSFNWLIQLHGARPKCHTISNKCAEIWNNIVWEKCSLLYDMFEDHFISSAVIGYFPRSHLSA